jgi:plasmid stabilization system protein ParE
MIIKWDPNARASYRQVARYINTKFGRKVRKEFMQRVKDTENLIKSTPNIGSIDPLYVDRAVSYRSIIINGLNKLVYRIDNDIIYIVAFWDTRREPKSQALQTE